MTAPPPFVRIGPERPARPVVLSVPHAGRAYGPDLLAAARVPRATLALLEDRLVDRLVWRAAAAGFTILVARAPRAEIDLNRAESDIAPEVVEPPPADALPSARARGGLGLVPDRLAACGPLWRGRIARSELERRIAHVHRPYHAALDALLRDARHLFGAAVLLDCHSMPPRGRHAPPIVFGDLHGRAAGPAFSAAAARAAEAHGFAHARNAPYAGGHIAARHGRPHAGIHAVQAEIDRAAYLGPDLAAPGPGFDAVARLIAGLAERLANAALEAAMPEAAE